MKYAVTHSINEMYGSQEERPREALMIRVQSKFLQQTFEVITSVLVIGALAMIWPGIMAIFIGAFLLLQSCCIEQEIAAVLLDRGR
jgi:hypothetical protein